jgi:PhnB protein
MKNLTPYLMFPGTCREALAFYEKCFQGETTLLQTFGESPIDFPADESERVFNAEFRAEGLLLRASDKPASYEHVNGNGVAMFATFTEREAFEQAYHGLAEGGKVLMPISDHFAMVQDPFEIQWMLAMHAE